MKIIIDDVIGWWPATAWEVRRQLDRAAGADVDVEIDSPGGSVTEGIAIFNLLRDYPGRVSVTVSALAASMATYIAIAGDVVRVRDNSTWMIHNVWSVIAGDHNDLRKQADIQESLTKLLAQKYAQKTGEKTENIRDMMDGETYLFGSEIVDAGFADEIVDTVDGDGGQTAAASAPEAFALARDRFAVMSERLHQADEEHADTPQMVAAALGSCGALGCDTRAGGIGWVRSLLGAIAPKKENGSMKESENVPNPKQGENDMEISKITAQELASGNPDLMAQIREEAATAERERIVALRAVDPLGLDSGKFAEMLDEHIEQGKTKTDLIVAVHQALREQQAAAEAALEKARKDRAADGKSLAKHIAEIEPGSGSDDGGEAAKEEAKKKKAIEIAKKINERGIS